MQVLFAMLINWLTRLFTEQFLHAAYKIAITLAFIALVIAALTAYLSGASALIETLSQTVPTVVNGVWGWVMPPNVNACLVAIVSATMLRFFANQYRLLLNAKFRAAISN